MEHEGRRYQRRLATWLDGGLRVPRVLSNELDTKAKQNPDFWKRCEDQDVEDDPRNRGVDPRTRLELSSEEIAHLFPDSNRETSDVESRAVPGHQSSSTPQRKRDQEHLDYFFRKNGELVLTGDINGGWRETTSGWRFYASKPVDLPNARILRCVASVVEDMSGHSHRRTFSNAPTSREAAEDCNNLNSAVPHFESLDNTLGPIRCSLDGDICRFFVKLLDNDRKLNKDLPWLRNRNGHWQFGFEAYGVYELAVHIRGAKSVARPFAITLQCTLPPNELIIR